MRLLVLVAIAAAAYAALGAGLNLVLWWVGEPPAWPLRPEREVPAGRRAAKILVPAVWVLVVLLAPPCLGSDPVSYYRAMAGAPPWPALGLSVLYVFVGFGSLHAVGHAAGTIVPWREHRPEVLRGKLLRRIFVVPLPAALIEELVFRGLVLEQLTRALPATRGGMLTALAVSSVVFSAVHFVAPKPPGESVARAALGLFVVGCAIGAGFLRAGHNLWMAVAIHAAGIACVEAPRLLTRFEPHGAWLTGSREFPHSGLYGIATISFLAFCLLAL